MKTLLASPDPLALIPRALTKLYSMWLCATYPFASMGRNVSIHYTCTLKRPLAHRICVGNSVQMAKDVWINVEAYSRLDEPIIFVGDCCKIGRRCQISARNRIELAANVTLSSDVLIMDHNHAYEDVTLSIDQQGVTEGGTIRIEPGCWFGRGAAIVCGTGELVIGRHCVVAANSYLNVSRNFPPYSVIAGNPARIVRQFDPEKGAWILGGIPSKGSEAAARPGLGTPNQC